MVQRAEQRSKGIDIYPVPQEHLNFDLVGVVREKNEIRVQFIWPLKYKKLFKQGKSLLMFGPPGTGKTKLAAGITNMFRATLDTTNVQLVVATAAQIKGRYIGDIEKNLERFFRVAEALALEAEDKKARTVLFFDELEAFASSRLKFPTEANMAGTTELNRLMDGITQYPHVIVVGATNLPWNLDPAILSRFPLKLFVDVPGTQARIQMLWTKFQDRVPAFKEVTFEALQEGKYRKGHVGKEFRNFLMKLTMMTGYSDRAFGAIRARLASYYEEPEGKNKDQLDADVLKFLDEGKHDPYTPKGGGVTVWGSPRAVTTFGFSFRDLDRVMDTALNHVAQRKLIAIDRRKNCYYIVPPGCDPSKDVVKCRKCDVAPSDLEFMPEDFENLDNQKVIRDEIHKHRSSVNNDEYLDFVYYFLYHQEPPRVREAR